ncbi:MAG: COG4223 family protein [Methyloceanibacter sp.]
MAGPLGDKDKTQGGAGKRPAPTIEGTATEVSVEPQPDQAAAAVDQAQPEVKDAGAGSGNGVAPEAAAGDRSAGARPSSPRRGTASFLNLLAAGLFGGLIVAAALAVAVGYLNRGDLAGGKSTSPEMASLDQRLAKLESAPPAPDKSEDNAELEGRVAKLEKRKPEAPSELAQLAERVNALEATIKTMAEAAKEGGSVADAAAISQQIAEAEQRLQAQIDKALVDGNAASATSIEGVQKELAELKSKFGALAEAELGAADSATLGPEIAALDERVEKLESMLPDLADAIGKDRAETQAATLAIAFANLRAAVNEGRPYAAELATLSKLSPGVGDLGGLIDFDDQGIPTLPELTRSFKATREQVLAKAAPAEGTFLDSLLAGAESLIKIRRVDAEATGSDAGAVLSRAEAKLGQGDLAESVEEVETLEAGPKAAFSAWLDQARARLGADESLKRLENLLLVSMSSDTKPAEDNEEDDPEAPPDEYEQN